MATPGKRARAARTTSLLILAGVTLTACSSVGADLPPQTSEPPAPVSITPNTDAEVSPGWDQQPDTAVTPDAELGQAEVDALLRKTASNPAASVRQACLPEQITFAFTQSDAALGHRYASLVAANSSNRSCTVIGWPGIGGRGEWGSAFLLDVEDSPTDPFANDAPNIAQPVTLAPGQGAKATLEWTGDLRGSQSEALSSLVVQLASDQHAKLYSPPTDDAAAAAISAATPEWGGSRIGVAGRDEIDIGMSTTVRVSTWKPINGPSR
ncbi:DUF4232 domain-containing protein [Pseudoclavibacter sp. CFCC 13796]|uniref:DUF4232 domain-containing protein n=1 Tax=Pseudoclavibacter sp. CFCC 13796 TaxID=2615179 RepID=UPI001300D917|nr:DUF4232 domain-containing protein [Pseudoclavibacter sp. CFCC 13796]KAB1660581.1 DUF4232 domain-containing protein [Pseudoclavibacter sp. CFCC 13796]